eukprot:243192-Alexandrium_andersonii.AAC.1
MTALAQVVEEAGAPAHPDSLEEAGHEQLASVCRRVLGDRVADICPPVFRETLKSQGGRARSPTWQVESLSRLCRGQLSDCTVFARCVCT